MDRVAEKAMKRYNLVLPDELFSEVERIADQHQTSVVEILRRFIKLGLLAAKIEETPGAALMIRENGQDRQIILI